MGERRRGEEGNGLYGGGQVRAGHVWVGGRCRTGPYSPPPQHPSAFSRSPFVTDTRENGSRDPTHTVSVPETNVPAAFFFIFQPSRENKVFELW